MSDHLTGDASARISSEIIVAAVIFVFVTVAFVFFVYLYVKQCISSEPGLPRYRARFMFAPSELGPVPRRGGLDTSILRSLPVTVFRSAEGVLECSVCLTELSEGEEARVLPKCSHGFHRECIDMWFHSHSTCPLCRCPVSSPDSGAASVEIPPVSTSGYPPPRSSSTRDRDQDRATQEGLSVSVSVSVSGSSSTGRMLVIEIPTRTVDDGFPSSISAVPEGNMKTPPSSRLRTLTRILSREKRTAESSHYSGRTGDIAGDAETPTNS